MADHAHRTRLDSETHALVQQDSRDNPSTPDHAPRLPRWDLIAGVMLAIGLALMSVLAPDAGVRALRAAVDAVSATNSTGAASPPPPEPPIAQQNAQAHPSAATPPL